MDAIEARIAELGQSLDLARQILLEPEIREGLADPARGLEAGSMVMRLLGLSCALQACLNPASRPAWIKPEPEPRDDVPEPGRAAH